VWQGVLAYVTCNHISTARNKLSCMDYNLVDAIKTLWLWLKTKVLRNFGRRQKLGWKMACHVIFDIFVVGHDITSLIMAIWSLTTTCTSLWPCHLGNCQWQLNNLWPWLLGLWLSSCWHSPNRILSLRWPRMIRLLEAFKWVHHRQSAKNFGNWSLDFGHNIMVFGNGIQRFVLLLWSLDTLHTNLTTWKTCGLWPPTP